MALVVSLVGQVPPAAAAPAPDGPAAAPGRSVPVGATALRSERGVSMPQAVITGVAWPKAGHVVVGAGSALARAGGVAVRVDAAATPAGDPRTVGEAAAETKASPAGVSVTVLDRSVAVTAGVAGLLLAVHRTDGASQSGLARLTVDYSSFRNVYGGDFGARLRLVRMPGCVLSTPAVPGCASRGLPLDSVNNAVAGVVSADVPVGPDPGTTAGRVAVAGESIAATDQVLALTASTSSTTGDWSQTDLSPTYSWAGGNQSGDFTYQVPMRVPAGLGGPQPQVGLSYSSGSVDGMTISTNSQSSWAGEGWQVPVSYIERQYHSCQDEGISTGDLCWFASYNATMVFHGRSVRLVKSDADGVWRSDADDGLKVEQVYGTASGAPGDNYTYPREYWKVTDLDGTVYLFGANRRFVGDTQQTFSSMATVVYGNNTGEPCNGGTYASSWCHQGYRWNLDYVVDPRGNSMSYFYTKKVGYVGANNNTNVTTYDIGSVLDRVEYGTRAGAENASSAPMRVVFGKDERCTGAPCTTSMYPDTPWDQYCSSSTSCPNLISPAYWTQYRLATVTTQVRNDTNTAWRNVDQWSLRQSFPATGDGTSPSLWLDGVTHTGYAPDGSTAAEPEITFGGQRLANRVDFNTAAGVPPMNRYRINLVDAGTGSHLWATYDTAECTAAGASGYSPSQNPHRCFPQYFSLDATHSGFGWFHKYVLGANSYTDQTGGTPEEDWVYDYDTAGSSTSVLWHHDDNEIVDIAHRSWSQWMGYSTVTVTHGATGQAQTRTVSLYLRGLDGDRTLSGDNTRRVSVTDSQGTALTDQYPLAGWLLESTTLDGPVSEVASTIHTPSVTTTGNRTRGWQGGTITSFMTRETETKTRTWLPTTSTWRWTDVQTSYDSYGLPTDVKDYGEVSVTGDARCTHTDYARNTTGTNYLVNFPSQAVTTDCASTVVDSSYLSGERWYYDGTSVNGTSPTKGLVTKYDKLASVDSGTQTWRRRTRTDYDTNGRATATYDALDNKTTTGYTPASGAPVTQTLVTNPLGHNVTADIEPGHGVPTKVTDPNTKTTNASYDPLGRLTKVWRSNRATTATPDLEYSYHVQDTAANWVSTKELNPAGNQVTSYTIYDGRLRARQTQTPAPQANGGRIITDTTYDNRGLTTKTSTFWNNTSGPTSTLATFADTDVANQHRYGYDNLQRQISDALWSANVQKWQTTHTYSGDRSTTTPPAGGIATESLVDVRGNTTELRQYLGGSISGTYQATKYEYDRLDRQKKVTDPAGNTWTSSYDLRGRLVTSTDPDTGTTTNTYDIADQLLTSTTPRGTLAYKYDDLGRKIQMWKDAVDTGTELASWTYDPAGAKGQLASSTRYVPNGAGVDQYTTSVLTYDDAYRPTSTRVHLPTSQGVLGGDWDSAASYNVDGSVATATFPHTSDLPDETLTYAYDNVGNPLTVTSGLRTYVSGTSYYNWGPVYQQYLALGTGGKRVRVTHTLDEATGRLVTNSTDTENQTTPGTWVERLTETYSYTNSGNVTAINETNAGTTVSNQCFTYDGLSQLQEAWTTTATTCQTTPTTSVVGGPDPYWTSYRYDTIGNRISEVRHDPGGVTTNDTTRTYVYPTTINAQPHTLTRVDGTGPGGPTLDTFTYTTTGDTRTRNISGKPGQTLTWDIEGHLATIADTAGTTSYLYDANGNRLVATNPDNSATLYLGTTEITRIASGAATSTRYYGNASRTTAGVTWLVADAHGTNQLAIDATTLAITRRKTDPFGNPRGNIPTWPNPHGFVGGVTDPTGLTHLGAREYDPTNGRFVSADPVIDVADPQQTNGYSYSSSNPVTRMDPGGEKDEEHTSAAYSNPEEWWKSTYTFSNDTTLQFDYDSDGNQVAFIDGVNVTGGVADPYKTAKEVDKLKPKYANINEQERPYVLLSVACEKGHGSLVKDCTTEFEEQMKLIHLAIVAQLHGQDDSWVWDLLANVMAAGPGGRIGGREVGGRSRGRLSSRLPMGLSKEFVTAYEEIRAGRGVRVIDPKTGKPQVFEGTHKPHEARWAGALEYSVPGAKDPSKARILVKTLPDGRLQMGYTKDHYVTILYFESPHFPDHGW